LSPAADAVAIPLAALSLAWLTPLSFGAAPAIGAVRIAPAAAAAIAAVARTRIMGKTPSSDVPDLLTPKSTIGNGATSRKALLDTDLRSVPPHLDECAVRGAAPFVLEIH
jgi:hypothetical protein